MLIFKKSTWLNTRVKHCVFPACEISCKIESAMKHLKVF